MFIPDMIARMVGREIRSECDVVKSRRNLSKCTRLPSHLRLILTCGVLAIILVVAKFFSSEYAAPKPSTPIIPLVKSAQPIMNQLGAILLSTGEFPELCASSANTAFKSALVIISYATSPDPELFGLLFRLRTHGKWTDDIVVVFVNAEHSSNLENLRCLRVRHTNISKEMIDEASRMRFSTAKAHSELLLFFIPILREYDIIQTVPSNARVLDAIPKLMPSDFVGTTAIILGISESGTTVREMNEKTKQWSRSNIFTISIFFWRIELAERLSLAHKIAEAREAVLTTRGIIESIFVGKVRVVAFGDPKFGSTAYQNPLTKIHESERAQAHMEVMFATALAQYLANCSVPDVEYPDLNLSTLQDTLAYGLPYLLPRKDVLAARFTQAKNADQINRVMTLWASKGFVEAAYSVVIGLRTVGQWDDDIVLITDFVTEEETATLDCLGVKLSFYSPEGFKKQFPWVEENHWYYKLLPFLMDDFRKYEIIQYLDCDVVITGPIKKRFPGDFDPGVTLLMEDNSWDESFIARELFWMDQNIQETKDILNLLKSDFPGIDTRTNGPNFSPSAGACFHALLVSRLPSQEVLMGQFKRVATRYHKILKWGDQPLMMLTFWGRWRMRHGENDWQTPFNSAFNKAVGHPVTGGTIRYIHTGGSMRPNLVGSVYKPFELAYRYWGMTVLNCPSLLF